MSLDEQQSETAVTPTGGERPPCVRGDGALHAIVMGGGLDVAGEVRSVLAFPRDGCLKCLQSYERSLR